MAELPIDANANVYPLNLDADTFWNYDLDNYRAQLLKESDRLFASARDANVKIIDAVQGVSVETEVKGFDQLKALLEEEQRTSEPGFRHAFIKGPSGLTKLHISREMFEMLCSRFKVMPSFLDFVFTFGEQQSKKNFHYSGFRAKELWTDSNIVSTSSAPPYHYQVCYNLRSVEPTKNPPEWPWSIRQSAVFHSFECDTGRARWINIKGSDDISNQVRRLCRPSAPSDPAKIKTADMALSASLATHLAYCEWSSKNWAAYISWLEDELQSKTRYALLAKGNIPRTQHQSRANPTRIETAPPPVTRASSFAQAKDLIKAMSRNMIPHRRAARRGPEDEELGLRTGLSTAGAPPQDFSYDDLRKLQFIEDQVNVTLLVIRSNISIMNELRAYYEKLEKSLAVISAFKKDHNRIVHRFSAQVGAVINDSKLQQSRTETLLQLLSDRKSLLLNLFAHRNMSTSKTLADKAQESSEKMEDLTEQMRQIALKTEKETIFMRIITVVTLFFLPGTFVATLMSTDIVRFQDDGKSMRKFSGLALGVYLAITIPIMLITFWAAFHFWDQAASRTEQQRRLERIATIEKS